MPDIGYKRVNIHRAGTRLGVLTEGIFPTYFLKNEKCTLPYTLWSKHSG
jgi:hypothetical protein